MYFINTIVGGGNTGPLPMEPHVQTTQIARHQYWYFSEIVGAFPYIYTIQFDINVLNKLDLFWILKIILRGAILTYVGQSWPIYNFLLNMFFWRWELYTHLYMNAIDTPKKYFLNSTIFLCFTGKKSSFAPPKMWFLKFIILRKKIARSVSRFLLNISGNYETPRLIRSRSQKCPTWHNWFWPVLPPWKLPSWHQH